MQVTEFPGLSYSAILTSISLYSYYKSRSSLSWSSWQFFCRSGIGATRHPSDSVANSTVTPD